MAPERSTTQSLSENTRSNVLRLGFVSLFNDLGSETLTRLIPLYVAGVLGASMGAVGMIEGLADSTSVLLKPLFGAWSDRLRKRKAFVVSGYLLSSGARPLLALAGSWPAVAFIRMLDRLGKGVRTAPRDALIAESSLQGAHGFGFGVNRALDTLGAVLGVSAFALWSFWFAKSSGGAQSLTPRTWIALTLACSVPGFIAVGLAAFGIHDAATGSLASLEVGPKSEDPKLGAGTRSPLPPVFKRYLAVIAVFSLANSSDAFILLRAKELGYGLTGILGLIILLNLVSSATAIPAAALSDRFGRRTLIGAGWMIYALAYGLLGAGSGMRSPAFFALIVGIYGLFYGFTESVERAWIADLIPNASRGRAYGIFGLVVGLSALPASVGFGWIWDHWGSQAAFLSGCGLAVLAVSLLLILVPRR